jgi:sensor c-di-GMP phosphodiesterase-like protein
MIKRLPLLSAFAAILSLHAGFVMAAVPVSVQEKSQTQQQEQIFGSQLMTQQERTEYRAKLGYAKNDEEREQIRSKHHKLMMIRAKARGLTLPDEPPVKGGQMGGGGNRGH